MLQLSPTALYATSGFLLVAGAGFIYFIIRTSPGRRVKGATAWLGISLSAAVILAALGLGTLTYMQEAGIEVGGDHRSVGRPAPELTFRMVSNDQEKRLSDYRGQVVLLNLWASWCAPCLEEIEELNQLEQAYGNRGVVVVMISDEPRQAIQKFEREHPIEGVNAYLPDETPWPPPYNRVERARPTTFVIDRQGIVRATWPGAANFGQFVGAVTPYL